MKTKAVSVLRGLVIVAVWILMATFGADIAMGQEATPAPERKDETQEQESANKQQLAVMRRLAETIQVNVAEGEHRHKAKLIPEPFFRFSDQSRRLADGSVWGWAVAGRPAMMAEFRTYDR